MPFLRVNDLLLACIVPNHDVDSPLYIIKNMFSLQINKKLTLEKCVYLLWKILEAWLPALRLKMTSNLSQHMAHGSRYAQIWLKGVDIKKNPPLFYFVCLRSFGAFFGWAYTQYRLCDLFMMMEHSFDDISDHE